MAGIARSGDLSAKPWPIGFADLRDFANPFGTAIPLPPITDTAAWAYFRNTALNLRFDLPSGRFYPFPTALNQLDGWTDNGTPFGSVITLTGTQGPFGGPNFTATPSSAFSSLMGLYTYEPQALIGVFDHDATTTGNDFMKAPGLQRAIRLGESTFAAVGGSDRYSMGYGTHVTNPGSFTLAIGTNAGNLNQGDGCIGLGYLAGQADQGSGALAVGQGAGQSSQGADAVAIGNAAGAVNQPAGTIALGRSATVQGTDGVGLTVPTTAIDTTTTPPTLKVSLTEYPSLTTPTSYNIPLTLPPNPGFSATYLTAVIGADVTGTLSGSGGGHTGKGWFQQQLNWSVAGQNINFGGSPFNAGRIVIPSDGVYAIAVNLSLRTDTGHAPLLTNNLDIAFTPGASFNLQALPSAQTGATDATYDTRLQGVVIQPMTTGQMITVFNYNEGDPGTSVLIVNVSTFITVVKVSNST